MPWCPKCGAEYRDGFTRCASCDVPLVDRLTDEQSKQANKSEAERECDKMVLPEGMSSPIAVYTAKNRLEAESIEEMLRDNDIPVFDRPAAFRQIQSYSGADARFGVELVVDASQTSRARQLIEQMQAALAENELSEDDLARLAEEPGRAGASGRGAGQCVLPPAARHRGRSRARARRAVFCHAIRRDSYALVSQMRLRISRRYQKCADCGLRLIDHKPDGSEIFPVEQTPRPTGIPPFLSA